MPDEHLLFHGARLDPQQTRGILDHIFQSNLKQNEAGKRGAPICIWGLHGIGKTSLVQDYAREHGWKFAYCAPAQFEEMGDLHGLPTRIDPDPDIQGDEYTTFLPPDWVPTEEGPGILLLDDINRADDRILRGLMQLLQNFEMFSWSLPAKWQIVATANPEGGDYSVTPMDDAMLTRMMHVTMNFDVKAWAAWALQAGVDTRGIDFVLTYPESVTGGRTTPRTLCQFFDGIQDIADLKANIELVNILGQSCLDEVTVADFLAFVKDNLEQLISPEEILDADDFAPVSKRVTQLSKGDGDAKRVDRLATICTRVYLHLAEPAYQPGDQHPDNLVRFLTHKELPNDLRFSLHKDLVNLKKPAVTRMMRNKKLADLVLLGM